MSVFEISIISLILCSLYYFIVVTFPENYKAGSSKNKINTLLLVSSFAYLIVAIVLYVIYKKIGILLDVDIKISLLLIPLTSIVLFSINIYYPAIRILAKQREDELSFANELISVVFNYKYKGIDDRKTSIDMLNDICSSNRKIMQQTGMLVYIENLIQQSQGATQKAPTALVDFCEEKCLSLCKEIDERSLMPFSNISMVSSFCLSYVLTILLTYISII